MKELQERYKDDKQKLGARNDGSYIKKQRALTPLGGCLPIAGSNAIFYWFLFCTKGNGRATTLLFGFLD